MCHLLLPEVTAYFVYWTVLLLPTWLPRAKPDNPVTWEYLVWIWSRRGVGGWLWGGSYSAVWREVRKRLSSSSLQLEFQLVTIYWLPPPDNCCWCPQSGQDMAERLDYYSVLGCDPSSSEEQIITEFRVRAKQTHPDKDGKTEEFQASGQFLYTRR